MTVMPRIGDRLSAREHEVMCLLSHGLTVRETGQKLFIAPNTVKSHLRRVYRKLGARNAAHAVAIAYRRGLLGMGASW